MALTTRGWGAQGGVISTQGFGCFFIVDVVRIKDRVLSPELQTLVNQIRIVTRCKVSNTALTSSISQRNVKLSSIESDLEACGQRLRALIKNTRIHQKQRRTP